MRWFVQTIDGIKFEADVEPREEGSYLVVVSEEQVYRIPHERVRLWIEVKSA